MSFGSYLGVVCPQLSLAALLATSVLAWRLGGKAERLGALLLTAGWLIASLCQPFASRSPISIPFASDAMDATGLLFVAIRYSSLWLGPAMLFYSGGFAARAMTFGAADAPRWHGLLVSLLVNDLVRYLVLLAIVGGTLAAVIQRRRTRATAEIVHAPASHTAYSQWLSTTIGASNPV